MTTQAQRDRQERFVSINRFVVDRGGWITSPPGEQTARLEVIDGSTLPSELRAAGYNLAYDGEGQRILHGSIVERFDQAGALIAEGSTRPVARTIDHAGIVETRRYSFDIGSSAGQPVKIA
jgi:hypothetical protein